MLIGLLIKILLVGSCAAITVQGIVLIVSGRHQSQINKLKLEIASLKAKRQQIIHDIEDKFGSFPTPNRRSVELIEYANMDVKLMEDIANHMVSYNEINIKQDELRRAIEKEDYIEAARLRDELKQLNQK